jgi:hypothetical protein
MHGLIFETSIWLLAGSTRFYQKSLAPLKAGFRLNRDMSNEFEHID